MKEEYTFLNSNYNSNRITKIQNNIINLEFNPNSLSYSYSEKKIYYHLKLYRSKSIFRTTIDEIIFLYKVVLKKIFKLKFRLKNKMIIFISGPDASGKVHSLKLKNIFNNYLNTKIYNIAKPYPSTLISFY